MMGEKGAMGVQGARGDEGAKGNNVGGIIVT